jgi:hypothetical protein
VNTCCHARERATHIAAVPQSKEQGRLRPLIQNGSSVAETDGLGELLASSSAIKNPTSLSRRELWLSVTAEFEKIITATDPQTSDHESSSQTSNPPTTQRTDDTAGAEDTKPTHRLARFFQWLIPTAALALIPKCPMCLAAYLALFTGTGVSFTAASHLRTGLIFLCIGTLVFLLGKQIRRNLVSHCSPRNLQSAIR